MDQAVTTFRSVAYDILRSHYDSVQDSVSATNAIPEGKDYDNFTDQAIGRQITQMLYITGKWFEMFECDSESPGEKLIQACMQTFAQMFMEACDSDMEHYENG